MFNSHVIRRAFYAALIASLTLLSSCGTSTAPAAGVGDSDTNTVAVVPAPTPTPTPPPTAAVPVPSNGLQGEVVLADNFEVTGGIERTSYPAGVGGGTPPQSIDSVGAFRNFCTAGQLSSDDPLVYPGQPGKSHLHQFFGNTGTNASSTYASLRTSGGTTCGTSSAPLNRSAYWVPAMLDGVGHVVKPDYLNVYYKRLPASDPDCQLGTSHSRGTCADLPNGLRYVVGYNMATMTGGPTDTNSEDHSFLYFECWGSWDGKVAPGSATGRYYTIADVAAAGCPVGARLVAFAVAPDCWDGKNLDSADHRSHMANGKGADYGSGRVCDAAHPYVIPQLQIQFHFTVDANLPKWHFSSDEMMPGVKAGTTFHFDYWEAWSPTVKATWHQYCINAHVSCSGGDLGNGTAMRGSEEPIGGFPIHQLVALP